MSDINDFVINEKGVLTKYKGEKNPSPSLTV